jgi:thioredoxin reductase (NADPH)
MTAPEAVLLIVGGDSRDVETTVSALNRRFGSDYRVLSAGSAADGLAELRGLARGGEQVALVAADLHLPDGDGVEFLERAAGLHPGVTRILLFDLDEFHTRIPFREPPALQRASALGRIDGWMVKGWVNPEEWLYPQVQEALSAWSTGHQPGHVVYRMIGEQWDRRSHDLRDALTVNGVPFVFHTKDSDSGRQLISDHAVDVARLPALIQHDGTVLQQPSMAEMALSHGIQIRPTAPVYDLVVLGAGPAGLAAAVYGGSEGLDTLVVETRAIGGQAGTSSMIRNYLGFHRGISGGELAHRAWQQATLLGAEFVFTNQATALTADAHRHACARGRHQGGRTSGHPRYWRSRTAASTSPTRRLIGAGVFYGAAGVMATAVAGEDVYVVGGANSAGQAALHLAKHAAHVTLLIRGTSLAAGMSDYLVRQIQATPNVEVRLHTRVVGGRGDTRLESLTLQDDQGQQEEVAAAAVFIMIGAKPHTDWLAPVLGLDKNGFVLTGRDIPGAQWVLEREPYPFETSCPGVFAAGDVRHGSIKRVAGAVGEGSVAVGSVHRYLAAAAPFEGQAKA